MFLCAAGDIHGKMEHLYSDVAAFEAALGVRFATVLQVGDFGVWPDHARVDGATRRHGDAGDFAGWLAARRPVPRPTVFIKGNHEDFDWLSTETSRKNGRDLLPGLTWLQNGRGIDLAGEHGAVRVVGVGGCFSPEGYKRRSRDLRGRALRHFTADECESAGGETGVDVLLLHDAPTGVEIVKGRGREERRYVSDAAGLGDLVARVRPRVCFFGHHHARVRAEIAGVPCVGLNLVGNPGHLVAFEIPLRGREWTLLGEGTALPVGFEARIAEGTLLVATDGLWKYMDRARIAEATSIRPLEKAAGALVDGVRLRSGALAGRRRGRDLRSRTAVTKRRGRQASRIRLYTEMVPRRPLGLRGAESMRTS